jgi:hypothetical protein
MRFRDACETRSYEPEIVIFLSKNSRHARLGIGFLE